MGKRGKVIGFFATLLVLGVVMHSVYHLFVYGTGISGFIEGGVSGIVIGDADFRDELQAIAPAVFGREVSRWFLIAEWVVLISISLFFLVRAKVDSKREVASLNMKKMRVKTKGPSTDLDTLYEILKEKKHLKLSTISKAYGIKKDLALAWGKTLESGHLIKVEYPFFGEPKFVCAENEVKQNEKVKEN